MIEWLALPANWIFLLALLSGLGLALLSLLGLAEHGDGDAHVDAGSADGSDGASGLAGLGTFLGVGRAPLSILLQVLLVSFGLAGLGSNAVLWDVLGATRGTFPLVYVFSAVASVLVTRYVGLLAARFLPSGTVRPRLPTLFIGAEGVTTSRVTPAIGQILVQLDGPVLLTARASGGSDIPRGTPVVVRSYDDERRIFVVSPLS